MKIVLITGLDGSGKSTLLEKIRKSKQISNYEIINLPVIQLDFLKNHKELYQAAQFINELNHESDMLKIPQLKAVALFASMLLFKKILSLVEQTNCKIVYCERHPLIDTGIYSQFYADKLFPGSIKKETLSLLDQKYEKELNYILQLIPETIFVRDTSAISTFLSFIYQWFHLEKKYNVDNLKKIFQVDLPDKIYYLEASPQILFSRIKNRKVLEAHESEQVFELLNNAYHHLFGKLNNGVVKIINATSIDTLDKLYNQLVKKKL